MTKTILIGLMLMVSQPQPTNVYVTKSGKKYHTNKECQYIKGKEVQTIPIEKAKETMQLCSRCAKQNEPSRTHAHAEDNK